MRRANRWYYGTRMNRREWTVLDEERRTSLHRTGGPAVEWDNGRKEWWTIFAWHIPETIIYQDGDMDWIRFGDRRFVLERVSEKINEFPGYGKDET